VAGCGPPLTFEPAGVVDCGSLVSLFYRTDGCSHITATDCHPATLRPRRTPCIPPWRDRTYRSLIMTLYWTAAYYTTRLWLDLPAFERSTLVDLQRRAFASGLKCLTDIADLPDNSPATCDTGRWYFVAYSGCAYATKDVRALFLHYTPPEWLISGGTANGTRNKDGLHTPPPPLRLPTHWVGGDTHSCSSSALLMATTSPYALPLTALPNVGCRSAPDVVGPV